MTEPRHWDAHCHLQDPRLAADLPGVLARARAAGVIALVVCATSEADWDRVLDLARAHAEVVPMLGLHPWYVDQAENGWEARLEARLRTGGAGLGECGLDHARDGHDAAHQEAAFRAQIRLARALAKPLAIHCRRAWADLARILGEEGLPAAGGLVHAFGGSAETARDLQDLGLHLSFGCAIGDPANRKAAKVLPAVCPDRLLLESDAPDLPPRHLPDWDPARPNEPCNLPLAASAAAALRGEPTDVLAARACENARRLFAGCRA